MHFLGLFVSGTDGIGSILGIKRLKLLFLQYYDGR